MQALPDVASLVLVVTARCNLRCRYCYQDRKRSQTLGWADARRAIDLLLRSPRRHALVEFVGGEPLLAFPLIRRAVAEVGRRRTADHAVSFEIVTNGLLLTARRIRFFETHGVDVTVSFDGVEAAQRLRGAGTFERLARALDRWRTRHPRFFEDRLTVTVTVVPSTVRHLSESVALLLAKDVRRLALVPAFCEQSDWRAGDIEALEAAFAGVVRASEEHHGRTGRVPVLLFQSRPPDFVPLPGNPPMCGVGSGRLFTVDVDGRIYGCAVAARSYQTFPTPLLREGMGELEIGRVGDADLAEKVAVYRARVAASPLFNDKRKKRSSYGRCAECAYVTQCAVCPAAVCHVAGNTDPHRIPDFQCAFAKVALACRDRFHASLGPS